MLRRPVPLALACAVWGIVGALAQVTHAATRPAVDTTTTVSTTTVPSAATTIPQGCPPAPTAIAVFVGVLRERDDITGTFAVSQLRAGSLEGYSTGDAVRVRYGTDVKFLTVGEQYLVGVTTDAASLVLSSSVRPSADLFGGAAVAGAVNGGQDCPTFEDPARTLQVDGRSVDSGVFTSFFNARLRLLLALMVPPVFVLAGLIALVLWKRSTTTLVPRR